jgi:hypothetical protein
MHEQNERQGKGENSLIMYQLNVQIEELTDNMKQLKGQVRRFSSHCPYSPHSCMHEYIIAYLIFGRRQVEHWKKEAQRLDSKRTSRVEEPDLENVLGDMAKLQVI